MMNRILIVDLGGQYCHLIKRTLADLGIACDIAEPSVSSEKAGEFAGIILSGGPQSVYVEDSPVIDPQLLDLGIPILGICYGHQLLAGMLGGRVAKSDPEYGNTAIGVYEMDSLLENTTSAQMVWMSHGDSVMSMPEQFIVTSASVRCPVASFHHVNKPIYGVQFHPEVSHTEHGQQMLKNFVDICDITPMPMVDRIEIILTNILATVGNKKVLFFVSGGVDSTVAFALCAKVLKHDQLYGVYVDTGLMRKSEIHDIRDCLERLGMADRLLTLDESHRFLSALDGVHDPEQKREIIGRLFVEVQQSVIESRIGDGSWLLGQGTIYPDVIESGPGSAAKIKTHHNQCAEIQALIAQGKVIEPLRDFYKDQVREIGHSLGLSKYFIERWPFPGPGLAIRCLCSDTTGNAEPVESWDHYDGLSGLYEFVRIPLRSVGVQGDARTYRTTLAVKGPLNKHDLTALARQFPEDRIIAHIAGSRSLVKAQVYPATLTPERIAILREADHVVRSAMIGYEHLVWQFPVVLLPLTFSDKRPGNSIVLRPVNSRDGMTADFVIPPNSVLDKIVEGIMAIGRIDAIFLDASDKPPATIEWE